MSLLPVRFKSKLSPIYSNDSFIYECNLTVNSNESPLETIEE